MTDFFFCQMTYVTFNWKQHHNVIKQEVMRSFTSEIGMCIRLQ